MRVPIFEFYMFYTILVSVGSVSRNKILSFKFIFGGVGS
nr:MAG TPA: hypothetical protein [Caudoviricetes sp.]